MSGELLTFSGIHLRPDAARTVIRPFGVEYPEPFRVADHPRMRKIVDRVISLSENERCEQCEAAVAALSERHRNGEAMLDRRFEEIRDSLSEEIETSAEGRLVIGAYLSAEYSFEAAALSNPSLLLCKNRQRAAVRDQLHPVAPGHRRRARLVGDVPDRLLEPGDPVPHTIPHRLQRRAREQMAVERCRQSSFRAETERPLAQLM